MIKDLGCIIHLYLENKGFGMYAEDFLSMAQLTNSKTSVPLEVSTKIQKEEGLTLPNPTLYL